MFLSLRKHVTWADYEGDEIEIYPHQYLEKLHETQEEAQQYVNELNSVWSQYNEACAIYREQKRHALFPIELELDEVQLEASKLLVASNLYHSPNLASATIPVGLNASYTERYQSLIEDFRELRETRRTVGESFNAPQRPTVQDSEYYYVDLNTLGL